MDDTELEAMADTELEQLALTIPVTDPSFRRIWTTYEARNFGLLAQVLANKAERENTTC
jgi:hypothetical protein